MEMSVHHPALILAPLGTASGALGMFALGIGYGEAPHLGLYMLLTGLWFGFVVAFGVWHWGNSSWVAAVIALIATWIGWELAVNLAMQLAENWLKAIALPATLRTYVGGFAAGAVGAFMTWAGAAAFTSPLRQISVAASFVSTGALFGLLLPWTNQFDSPAILLLPWQTVVAAILGYGLAPRQMADPNSGTLSQRSA